MSKSSSTPELSDKKYLRHNLFDGINYRFGKIPVEQCQRGHFQSRRIFTEQQLQELAESIKATGGNVQPITVRPKLTGGYEIIAGERRCRATMIAGIDTVMALIGDFTDEQAAVACLTENIQREDLNPIEEAEGFALMRAESNLKQKEIAELVGKTRTYVANSLRLLDLDFHAKELVLNGKLSAGHAKALLALKHLPQQREMAIKCSRMDWSVRELENRVRKLANPTMGADSDPYSENQDIARLEEYVSENLGHPCRIKLAKDGAGNVSFKFFGAGDFAGIMKKVAPDIEVDEFMRDEESDEW